MVEAYCSALSHADLLQSFGVALMSRMWYRSRLYVEARGDV